MTLAFDVDVGSGFNRAGFYPSVGVEPPGAAKESDRLERIANDRECWVKNGVYRAAAIDLPGVRVLRVATVATLSCSPVR
ncbi:hypothetical protein RHD99_12240 [Buttiauxella selenatireducens]|uniref:Uncharacterized protein n=1 Tax=Buttiauxella selenatireducens TaxID=3073902 RepID=A0ABY9S479_9ENTR|nr:hypothetical protein [Buttiauxella sp. R73]WMY72268.1 hypothetical protein RHD99_12240 [Buttiauxella sp. R73]